MIKIFDILTICLLSFLDAGIIGSIWFSGFFPLAIIGLGFALAGCIIASILS